MPSVVKTISSSSSSSLSAWGEAAAVLLRRFSTFFEGWQLAEIVGNLRSGQSLSLLLVTVPQPLHSHYYISWVNFVTCLFPQQEHLPWNSFSQFSETCTTFLTFLRAHHSSTEGTFWFSGWSAGAAVEVEGTDCTYPPARDRRRSFLRSSKWPCGLEQLKSGFQLFLCLAFKTVLWEKSQSI